MLVLPDMDDGPTECLESFVSIAIAGLVPCDLPSPPLRVAAWHRAVVGATMPEAAVHLNGDLSFDEGDVYLSAR